MTVRLTKPPKTRDDSHMNRSAFITEISERGWRTTMETCDFGTVVLITGANIPGTIQARLPVMPEYDHAQSLENIYIALGNGIQTRLGSVGYC